MTTKIMIAADLPEYQRHTHYVRVTNMDNTNTESHHTDLKHGERTDAYVYEGRYLIISEELIQD